MSSPLPNRRNTRDATSEHGETSILITQPDAATSPPSNPCPITQAKAERMLHRLHEQYETGRQANLAEQRRGISTAVYSVMYRVSDSRLRRCKMFARLFSDNPGSGQDGLSQLDDLCNLRRPGGLPLHIGYVAFLMTIKDAEFRQRMAEVAAFNGWSPQRLHKEIRTIEQRPPGHGRTVQLPSTVMDGLQHVLREGNLWLTRSATLVEAMLSDATGQLEMQQPRVQNALQEFAGLMHRAHVETLRLAELIRS